MKVSGNPPVVLTEGLRPQIGGSIGPKLGKWARVWVRDATDIPTEAELPLSHPAQGGATYYDGPHASMYLAGYASDGGTQHASQDAAEAAWDDWIGDTTADLHQESVAYAWLEAERADSRLRLSKGAQAKA